MHIKILVFKSGKSKDRKHKIFIKHKNIFKLKFIIFKELFIFIVKHCSQIMCIFFGFILKHQNIFDIRKAFVGM